MNRKHVSAVLLLLAGAIICSTCVRAATEDELIGVLKSDAKLFEKARACQELAVKGTKKAVPALETLLGDEKLSGYARYALEPMDDPSVDRALLSALGRLKGRQLAGVVNSIGVRKDENAVGELKKLAADSAKGVQAEALMALGAIATEDSVRTITRFLKDSSAPLRRSAADAALKAADLLSEGGKKSAAAGLFESISKAEVAGYLRAAGIYGSIMMRGPEGVPLLVENLKSSDKVMVATALRAARELPASQKVSDALSAGLVKAKPALQVLLIKVLVDRKDAGAAKAMADLASGSEQLVRIESLKALGTIGDQKSVGILLRASVKEGEEAAAALNSLRSLKGAGVDRAIILGIESAGAKLKTELISVLSDRRCSTAVPQLLKEAASSDRDVARASLKALAVLAGEKDQPALLDLLAGLKSESARGYAEKAIISSASQVRDKSRSAGEVLKKLASSKDTALRVSLLSILGKLANDPALDAVVKATGDKSGEVKDAAVRALASWPDDRAAPKLLEIMRASGSQTHRTLALRGYVRILGKASGNPAEIAGKYAAAMKHVKSDADRKLLLGGLAAVPDIAAFDIARKYVKTETVRSEAILATVSIAEKLAGHHPEKLQRVLNDIFPHCKDPGLTSRVRTILRKIKQMRSYLVAWEICGPFTKAGKMYNQLFDIALGPEKPSSGAQKWVPIPAGTMKGKPWLVDVLGFYGGQQRVAYLRTRVFSPKAQPARLELGSDDGVKVWLNGKLVHANNAARAAIPGSDKANIELREGWNQLMVKLTQNVLGWELVAAIRARDGKPIAGMKSAILSGGEPVVSPDPVAPPAKEKDSAYKAAPREDKPFFNGKDLTGWKGTEKYWKVEEGAIVGSSAERVPKNEFIWSAVPVKDFYFVADVKLDPVGANAGIQFRSKKINEHGQAHGYQADVGRGFWGKLYHEHGRGKLDWTNAADKAVKHGEWNRYEILAVGDCVWAAINGKLSVSIDDPKGEKSGHIALQIHSGAPQTVRYRIKRLVHDPEIKIAGMNEEQLRAALKKPLR